MAWWVNNLGPLAGAPAALTAAFFWAIAVNVYGRVGQHVRPLEMNLFKGVIAVVLLTATLLATGKLPTSVAVRPLVLLIVSGAVGIGFGDTMLFHALERLGARRTLLFMLLAPPLSALIAHAGLDERLGLGAWLGITVTVGGVGWVVTERSARGPEHPEHLWSGIAFGAVSGLAQAVGAVLSRKVLVETEISPLASALVRLAACTVFVAIWLLASRRSLRGSFAPIWTKRLWPVFFFAACIGTYLGIWLQQVAFKLTATGIAQTLLSTSPLFGLLIAVWRREQVSARAVLGALIALGGIALLFRLAG